MMFSDANEESTIKLNVLQAQIKYIWRPGVIFGLEKTEALWAR